MSTHELSIRIKLADNGVIIEAHRYPEGPSNSPADYKEETYIYKTLDEALKDVPSIISVLKDGDETKNDKINKRTASGKEANMKMDAMIAPRGKE